MKKNKSLIIILLIVVIGLVGLTLAYFTNTANITNEFKSKEYGTTVTEEFTSPENWLPGSTEPKTLTVTNSGQVDEAVRVSYTETWTSKNGDNLSLTQGDNRAAIINLANVSDWTPVIESDNKTYYYYNYKLTPGETTSTLLDSVTFNSAITNDSNCVTENTETGKTVTCTSTGDGYDGATYKLVFKIETVQYDKYGEAWGTSAAISNDSKPLVLKGLKVNNINKTYEDGDRTAMFAFSHPQTEQMKATTDYRYIGNVPNNYVKFNCDNDGTNCEIWRIIGVFEVDDGTGNYQQRIKLLRGSALSTIMSWDDRESELLSSGNGKNEWLGAKISIFLNSDYLNKQNDAVTYGLKESARNLINNSKYYLGGRARSGVTPTFGNTEDIYAWERGTSVYNENDATRTTSWIGIVGLLYPSDNYMTYAKGVDNTCYNDPYNCGTPWNSNSGIATTGWIYNSSTLEGQENRNGLWTISPYSGDSYRIIDIESYGAISDPTGAALMGIRPVVYLKPSIQIISGEGTEQDPYILG